MARCSQTIPLAALFVASTASAQVTAPIEESITRGAQIEDAIGRSTSPGQPVRDDQAIDGEAGIYVLKRESIFFVAGSAGFGYATNPLRTADDVGGSASFEASASLGLRTRLAEAFDFGASLNVERTDYFEAFAPSSSVASGNISLGSRVADTPISVGIAGFGGWSLDRKFKNAVAFYGAAANVSAAVPLSRTVIVQSTIAATRQFSEISENNTKSVSARVGLTLVRGPLSASVSGSASRIWFDDFYENVTFVRRNDWQYEAAGNVAYQITPAVLAAVTVRYTRRDSPFFLADYDGVEGGATLSLVWRF